MMHKVLKNVLYKTFKSLHYFSNASLFIQKNNVFFIFIFSTNLWSPCLGQVHAVIKAKEGLSKKVKKDFCKNLKCNNVISVGNFCIALTKMQNH